MISESSYNLTPNKPPNTPYTQQHTEIGGPYEHVLIKSIAKHALSHLLHWFSLRREPYRLS